MPVGVYSYTAVNPVSIVNPPAAAWHPSGDHALILNVKDTVHRYDAATKALTQVASAGSTVTWKTVSYTPDGAKAVLLGNTTTEGRIYLWDEAAAQLTQLSADTFAGGTYESIAWKHDGSGEGRVLASRTVAGGSYNVFVWPFTAAGGRVTAQVFASSTGAGCQDLDYATDAFGLTAVAVTCGVNGVELFHLDGNEHFVQYTLNAGNTSRIAARPQGDYALAVGWSGQRVYRFEQGGWSTAFGNPTFPGIYQVQFATDGKRALVIGQAGGSPVVGRVVEFRHDVFTQAGMTDVSIPNFALAPYYADSSVTLNDAAWRPGCDGGLLVGGSNTVTSQKAVIIRFSVDNGAPCPN